MDSVVQQLQELELARSSTYVVVEKKTWSADSGAIAPNSKDTFYIPNRDDHEALKLIPKIKSSVNPIFLLIHGHRQSGKSTYSREISYHFMSQPEFVVVSLTFQGGIIFSDVLSFWKGFLKKIHDFLPNCFELKEKSTAQAYECLFFEWFNPNKNIALKNKKVILLLDELDLVISASKDVLTSFLGALRTLKHMRTELASGDYQSALHTVLGFGVYQLNMLSYGLPDNGSPFNVSESIQMPHFTEQEHNSLFYEYCTTWEVQIEKSVLDEIWFLCLGHPGLTCKCGKEIHNYLRRLSNQSSISFQQWAAFKQILYGFLRSTWLFHYITNYLDDEILKLYLETHFMGLQTVHFVNDIYSPNYEKNLKLLTSGILSLTPDGTALEFTCPMIRNIFLFSEHQQNTVELPQTVFDPTTRAFILPKLIALCLPQMSLRTIKSQHTHNSSTHAPNEFSYQFELYSALRTTLPFSEDSLYYVFAEVRHDEMGQKRADILIRNRFIYVIELAANATQGSFVEHQQRTSKYKSALRADHAVFVNFTNDRNHLEFCPIMEGIHTMVIYVDFEYRKFEIRIAQPNGSPEQLQSLQAASTTPTRSVSRSFKLHGSFVPFPVPQSLDANTWSQILALIDDAQDEKTLSDENASKLRRMALKKDPNLETIFNSLKTAENETQKRKRFARATLVLTNDQ